MPSTRSIPSAGQPLPVSTQQDFNLPPNNHLLITAPSRILSWDDTGLHTLFTSSKSGIAAATESKDGTGILAVADKHIVVLHDTKRGQEKSWGLAADEDEVRHLEYTTDSKSLFLSTKVTNAVQCYSTQRQRLLSPPQMLSSPPVALAISPTSHLMLSAEGKPPVVYLKDLVQNTAPAMLMPQGSDKAVSAAAFHPERPNVFLLAFIDGTLAVYDAGRLSRTGGDGAYMNQYHMGKAEIGRIDELHRSNTAKVGGKPRAITGAAFLPGHKSRVVSVGSDGKCKLVEFADGSVILRAWHCKAPLTSVSVLPVLDSASKATTSKGKERARDNASSIIAVGTEDGKVLLYDNLGLLQARKKANETGERVISVEWIAGPSPKAITSPALSGRLNASLINESTPRQRSRRKATLPLRKSTTPSLLRQNPTLNPPQLEPPPPSQQKPRRFTVHPDEVEIESTIRHTPSAAKQPPMITNEAGPYLDLFSPVNPFRVAEARQQKQAAPKSPRTRPRISSQTFSKDPTPVKVTTSVVQQVRAVLPSDSHATSSDSWPLKTAGLRSAPPKSRRVSTRHSPLKVERRKASTRSPARREHGRSESLDVVDPTAAANARLLRDLRQMNAKSATAHAESVLQGYASKSGPSTKPEPPRTSDRTRVATSATTQAQKQLPEPKASKQITESHVYGRDGKWLTDSVSDDSWPDGNGEDIWITSDEERQESTLRRHHLFRKSPARPPARQTSRSRMDSKGTASTVYPAPVTQPVISPDEFTTARSNFSADGTFSPASEDVRSLFPRASSLSPGKNHRGAKMRSKTSPRKQQRALQDMSANAVLARQPSSPWARAKKAREVPVDGATSNKRVNEPQVHVDDTAHLEPTVTQDVLHSCCTAAVARADALESEVAHMKGEILALKAALRRNGIPAPTVTRR